MKPRTRWKLKLKRLTLDKLPTISSPTRVLPGDLNSGELAQAKPGVLRDANQMETSERQHSDAGVMTPDASQETQSPLGFPPNEPLGDVVIPMPGFTSAFFYDPYVEIKDFLDALKSGNHFRVGVGDDGVPSETKANTESESQLQQSDNPQVSVNQPNSARPGASDTEAAMIGTESNSARSTEAANADPDSKEDQLPASIAATDDEEKAVGEPPHAAAAAFEANSDASGRGYNNSESELVESTPPEYTAPNEPETASKVSLGEQHSETKSSQGTEMQQCSGSLEQQWIPSADATQTPTAAPVKNSLHQTLGFAASLTASFAPETRSAWAQLFGSKYEDEIAPKAATHPSPSSQARHPSEDDNLSEGRVSVKAKLEQERKLDQQIQASQQKFKERSLRKESSTSTHHHQQQQSPKRQGSCSTAPIPFKPFEMAGLSITNVRFCVEKALQATCKCFQQLHALALNEPRIPRAEAEHGVFVSQWELELLLQELFGPPRGEDTKTTSSSSQMSYFALADPQYAGVPLELLLQVTWFIPFDQLTRLRSLVLQITRKHLNEHKLAVLNRHLQKQLLLIPYPTRLQQVLLQFSGHRPRDQHVHDPNDDDEEGEDNSMVSTAPPLVHCTSSLVRDLLECIAVPVSTELVTALGDKDFLLLSPFELVQKWRLSSLLCIQRVIFFRFLVEAIATERASNNSNGGLRTTTHKRELSRSASQQSVRSVQSRTKAAAAVAGTRRKQKAKTKKKSVKPSQSASTSGDSESESSEKLKISRASVVSTHGSTTSLLATSNTDPHDSLSGAGTGSKTGQQLHKLQQKLLASLHKLEGVIPWLLYSDECGSPAIKATYLAASAFHQSLDIMIKSHLALDCDIMDKLQHFIEAIDALIAAAHTAPSSDPQVAASRLNLLPHPAVVAATIVTSGSSSRLEEFPPPFPDLTREQEKARFPPPYEPSGTSYWAFKPELPQPAASVAKPSTAVSVIHPALYPAHPSPGVGAYDIQRSDRVTFQQKPGHSFRKAEIGGGESTPTFSKESGASSTPNKPRIYKGSAFARPSSPAVLLSSDNNLESSEQEPLRYSVGVGAESRSKPEPQDDHDDDDERLEVDILNALRRQHNMVVNDFMADILLQHHPEQQSSQQPPPPSYNTSSPSFRSPAKRKAKPTPSRKATTTAPQEPVWQSSSESRFVNRMRGRAPSSPVDLPQQLRRSSTRPHSARESAKPDTKNTASPVKPRSKNQQQSHLSKPVVKMPLHEKPSVEHLAWAARISDFYRAKRDLGQDDT